MSGQRTHFRAGDGRRRKKIGLTILSLVLVYALLQGFVMLSPAFAEHDETSGKTLHATEASEETLPAAQAPMDRADCVDESLPVEHEYNCVEHDCVEHAPSSSEEGYPSVTETEAAHAFFDDAENTPDTLSTEEKAGFEEIGTSIDGLPSLDEVESSNYQGMPELRESLYAVRNLISQQLEGYTDAQCRRFDATLGSVRIEKYNGLIIAVESFFRDRGIQPFSLGTATPIDIALGWFEVRQNIAYQYQLVSSTILGTYANPDGYVLSGSRTTDGTIAPTVYCNPVNGPAIAPLYFRNLVITNNRNDCVRTTACDVTIVLVDGTTNNLTCNYYDGGAAIAKNDATDGRKLTISCEHADEPGHRCVETGPNACGRLNALASVYHAAAIGSTRQQGINVQKGGFANLTIRGGIITARSGEHTPGIGSMCGTSYIGGVPDTVDYVHPQMLDGQICKNIVISGGRVYAYGGAGCSGIGSGWGGPVDGIDISNGAYVRAEGGTNSPGIGSGGYFNVGFSYGGIPAPGYDVSNISISGGLTVVEALGSTTADRIGYTGNIPGIGAGLSYDGRVGTVTNVRAKPDPHWYAMIKQGTTLADAQFVAGSPSPVETDILPNMYYTLVYFAQVEKLGSVNGGPQETGASDSMIRVSPGDTVRYSLTSNSGNPGVRSVYTMTDTVPVGMTLVTTAGSYSPGMTWGTDGTGTTTVAWNNQLGPATFFFTVTVDPVSGVHRRDYINQGTRTDGNITLRTNRTFHYVQKDGTLRITKQISGFEGLSATRRSAFDQEPFTLTLSGAVEESLTLMHGEMSSAVTVPMTASSVTVEVSEIVPAGFDSAYTVSSFVTHENGSTSRQSGRSLTVLPSDTVLVTVTNYPAPSELPPPRGETQVQQRTTLPHTGDAMSVPLGIVSIGAAAAGAGMLFRRKARHDSERT